MEDKNLIIERTIEKYKTASDFVQGLMIGFMLRLESEREENESDSTDQRRKMR